MIQLLFVCKQKKKILTDLLEANIIGVFSEALAANVQTIFADQTMTVRAGTAKRKIKDIHQLIRFLEYYYWFILYCKIIYISHHLNGIIHMYIGRFLNKKQLKKMFLLPPSIKKLATQILPQIPYSTGGLQIA